MLKPQSHVLRFSKGLDEGTDPKNTTDDALLAGLNLTSLRVGELETRYGFTEFASAVSGLAFDGLRGIFSTGKELCLIGTNYLYRYDNVQAKWATAGRVSPVCGEQSAVGRGYRSYDQTDVAINGDYSLQVSRWEDNSAGTAVFTWGVEAKVINKYRQTVQVPITLETKTSGIAELHQVRACEATGQLLFTWVTNAPAGAGVVAGSIRLGKYVLSTPASPPVIHGTVVNNDVFVDAAMNARRYDTCTLSDGSWAIAYVRFADQKLVVLHMNATTHAVISTLVIANIFPYYYVSLCAGSSGTLAILASGTDLVNPAKYAVNLYKVDTTDWTTYFVREIEGTATVGAEENAQYNLGIAYDNSEVALVWEEQISTGLLDTFYVRAANTTVSWPSFGAAATIYKAFNVIWRSKPYYTSYGWIADAATEHSPILPNPAVDPSAVDEGVLVSTGVLVELRRENGIVLPKPCLVHDVGLAPPRRRATTGAAFLLGSLNNIRACTFISSASLFLGTVSRQFSMYGMSDRYGTDMLIVDSNYPVFAANVTLGAAVISGGYVSWYVGSSVNELGYLAAPHIVRADEAATAGGALALGDYLYVAVWESYDAQGNYHRSAPSAPVAETVTAGKNSVLIQIHTEATYRDEMHFVVYRADTTGVFLRITEPLRAIPNIDSAYITTTYTDLGNVGLDILYNTAEVEPFITEGASIVKVIKDRLWLAGLVHGERVVYSKSLARGTPSQPVAPEVNDIFSYSVPNAERVTGLAGIGDAVIVFTKHEVYGIAGQQANANGENDQSSGLDRIPGEGCIDPRSVVSYPGGVFWQSSFGMQHMDLQYTVTKVRQVKEQLATFPVITSAVLVEKYHQVRFTANTASGSAGVILVYDYLQNIWLGYWMVRNAAGAIMPFLGACVHDNVYYVCTSTKVYYEDLSAVTDCGTSFIQTVVDTAHLQFAEQSGWGCLWSITPLLEKLGDHDLKITIFKDFAATSTSYTWTYSQISGFHNLPIMQPRYVPLQRQGNAYRVRIESVTPSAPENNRYSPSAPTKGRAFKISGIRFDYGVMKGPVKPALAERN